MKRLIIISSIVVFTVAVAVFTWQRAGIGFVRTVDPDLGHVTTTTVEPRPFVMWTPYHNRVTTTSPCAMSMAEVRAHHGAEDDLCAAWIGPRGYVHVGPLSDAPAYAHMVGG